VSNASTRLNIIDSNGFGLAYWFKDRCHFGEYEGRDALFIYTQAGEEKIVLISGGGKEGDERLIKGNSYGTAYITEVNECCKTYVKEVFDRTLTSSKRWIGHDLNPKAPTHWYYKEILEFYQQQDSKYPDFGFNYGHFTLLDNLSLSDDAIRTILRTYDKNSVWYRRDILGLREAAQGVIHDCFNQDRHLIRHPDEKAEIIAKAKLWYVSTDYGTGTVFVHGLFCIYKGKKYLVKCFYWDAKKENRQKADEDYVKDLKDLLKFIAPRKVQAIVIPDDALSYIAALRNAGVEPIVIYKRTPGSVLRRIRVHSSCLSNGTYFIFDDKSNWPVIEEYPGYIWDPKAQEKGEDEPLKLNDHGKDMESYMLDSFDRFGEMTSSMYV
jgi:PBSX family phage terminase large subunit